MICTKLLRNFASFNIINSVKNVKALLRAPLKHIKAFYQPSGSLATRYINTTEDAFDQVAHQWQTAVAQQAFDLQTFQGTDSGHLTNFGTVDNPCIIFTADTPFRFVACTGPPNEDDYESHELVYMVLREGPMQRCQFCGQVFKLVRLRNDDSQQNFYYKSSFMPYDWHDMAQSQILSYMSVFKVNAYNEYTQLQDSSQKNIYSMIPSDEHDRVLMDPAYRLQKLKLYQQRAHYLVNAISKAQKKWRKQNPQPPNPMSKQIYEALINVQAVIKQFDRLQNKVYKFHVRKFIDPDNHARRQKRMKERSEQRWDSSYTVFSGRLTEQEQKFKDYFQTELQKNPVDEQLQQARDLRQLLKHQEYQFRNVDLVESNTAEDTHIGYIQKLLFNFKYRQARNQDHAKRQAHMIEEQAKRFESAEVQNLLSKANQGQLRREYLEFVAEQGLRMVKDYYRDENFQFLTNLPKDIKASFAELYQNHSEVKLENSTYRTYKLPQWNSALGVTKNLRTLGQALSNIPASQLAFKRRKITEQELRQLDKSD